MEKFWKSKKLLKKSNGQILDIKNSFQKLINWANFGNQKFISEIKRTNFEIKNSCTLEIMRTDFGNQKLISAIKRRNFGNHWKNPVIHVNQADNQRIKANNYFSDAPRTPWTLANWDISTGEMIRAIDESISYVCEMTGCGQSFCYRKFNLKVPELTQLPETQCFWLWEHIFGKRFFFNLCRWPIK